MMDGFYKASEIAPKKSLAFLTPEQVELYGGYAGAMKTLQVDLIRHPIFLDEHWPEFESHQFAEVGHA